MAFTFKSNYPQIARESGFRLRQYKDGPLDWRLVGTMEVDRILREQQFEHIDAILLHLSEAPLASMLDSNVLDSGVAKYFTLSQLGLQYMIFCRKFLDESVRTLRHDLTKLETQNLSLRTINQEQTSNILQLHKKLSQVEAIHEIVFPCHVCTKNFVSNEALNIHLSKKHLKIPSPSTDVQGKNKDQTLIDTIKLELEIKQLKERLNVAEKNIRQTSEIKKSSPAVETTKSNSGTQVDIKIRSVGIQANIEETKNVYTLASESKDAGIQCNLIETKESDTNEDYQISSKDMSASNHYEKHIDDDNRVDILFDIREKVSNLETFQQTYSDGNQQSINDIKLKLSEITKFIETQIKQNAENMAKDSSMSNNTPSQILPTTSIDQLHEMLSKMFLEVSKQNFESTNRIITNIEKNYEQKLSTLEVEKQDRKVHKTLPTPDIQFPKKIDSVKKFNDNVFSSRSSRTSSSIKAKKKCRSSSAKSYSCSSTDVSLEESNHSFPSKRNPALDNTNIIHELESKLDIYGLNIESKSISAIKAIDISNNLLEQRNALQSKYPTFYKTRKRLNKLVELIISEKNTFPDRPEEREQNNDVGRAKQTKKSKIIIDGSVVSDRRMERILKSPLKKPTSYVSPNNKDVMNPVPLPRKHVMFNTEKKQN
ncbi:cilium assembly protein DZIP1L [Eupeodes corollae]|uniref:cilium assembly protein DZIP1L n=1 Tax=Eupeodes corollae TaxID=290404 RepID=UPI002491185C|nr:cilium assembly protein DZIP1L [Eupeodes corollae]